jgi:hypothetical protein
VDYAECLVSELGPSFLGFPSTSSKPEWGSSRPLFNGISKGGAGDDAHRFLIAAQNTAVGRRLFTTRSGMVRLGPRTAAAGSLVCVLYGARMSFVLKSTRRRLSFGGIAMYMGW